jgi:hypothetical protein
MAKKSNTALSFGAVRVPFDVPTLPLEQFAVEFWMAKALECLMHSEWHESSTAQRRLWTVKFDSVRGCELSDCTSGLHSDTTNDIDLVPQEIKS